MTKTETGDNFEVKSMDLASRGHLTIEWAEKHMPVLLKIRERFEKEKPLSGIVIGACLHVTKETAVLALTLQAGGADLHLCASNPLSTTDEVAAALVERGIPVYAWKDMDNEGYYRSIAQVIKSKPEITVDDGADLVSTLHKLKRGESGPEMEIVHKIIGSERNQIGNVLAGAEETTTGVIRLRAMANDGALLYPILATNDTPTKRWFDNEFGTGQSTFDGILRATADLVAGSVVVVAGFGYCGRGIAYRARGLGARRVIVTEVDNLKALRAAHEGFEVMPMADAAPLGNFFITATGCKSVVRADHVEAMKSGAVIGNSGHFDIEIDVPGIKALAKEIKVLRPGTETLILPDNRIITILGDGRLCNLANAEGHPSQVMDLSFSDQALAVEWVIKNRNSLKSVGGKVIEIPEEIDRMVADLKCNAMGLEIDVLSPDQQDYLSGWKEGTA
ncbi:MAG: adenosylhomocysteinase [Candidatus Heimdallarchaeota archaeon]